MEISPVISPVKRKFCAVVVLLVAGFGVSAATLPIYINSTPFISPPQQTNIDARAWWNRALFNVTPLTGLPFESLNTRNFTNAAGAVAFRGPIYYASQSPVLAALNGLAVVYEWNVDENGKATFKGWEWK